MKVRKQVTELLPGDIIDPPAGEKKWLWRDGVKRRYTVQSVKPGNVTAKGQFYLIQSLVISPYSNEESDISCQMLETKKVTVY